MKYVLALFTLAMAVIITSAHAGEVGPLFYVKDRTGVQDWVIGGTLYTNEVVAGTTAVSATCPNNASYIKFDPGISGDFRTKANGTGAPGAVSVSDGTGWRSNVAELQPINMTVSGTLISSYAVYSTVTSNTVPYACYGK